MTTLFGMVTFGNLGFSKLAIRGIKETYTGHPDNIAFAVVVGKPGDFATSEWVREERASDKRFNFNEHKINRGFAASCNDLWDFALTRGFDNLVIIGNDVVPYPGAVEAMIKAAEERPEFDVFSGSQFDAKSLVARYPEARKFFSGSELAFTDFSARPWELHTEPPQDGIAEGQMCDVQNFTMFRRSAFEKIGYFDPNYAFNSYFSDNDQCRRASLGGVISCTLKRAGFFHFVSRCMNQERRRNEHDRYFQANERYYHVKWGGPVGGEKFTVPFNGKALEIAPGVIAPSGIKIGSRLHEDAMIEMWAKMA